MTLSSKNIISLALLIAFLGAVLYAGTLLDKPSQELTNQQPQRPQSTESLLTHESKQRELELIKNDFKTVTPQEAYNVFKERNAHHGHEVQHEYAHLFGHELYDVVGIPGVAICDSMFAFGCFHSFFGSALMENGLDIIFELEAACIEAYGEKGLGCQHGIGHGILAELGTDELLAALETCSKLQWEGPLGGCSSGVHMEYNFNTMNNAEARQFDPKNPYYPCDEVGKEYSESCYFELTQWWESSYRSMLGLDFSQAEQVYKQIAHNCAVLTDDVEQTACNRGLGHTIAATLSYTTAEIKKHCSVTADEASRTSCLEAAAWLVSWQPAYQDTWQDICSELSGRSLAICLQSKEMI